MFHHRLFQHTRRHPSAILLLVQLMGMVLYPFLESTRAGLVGFNLFGVVILGFTVRMVRNTPGQTSISATLASIIICGQLAHWQLGLQSILPWVSAFEALFYFYAAYSLIAYMMEDYKATTDELFAAGAAFTLLAWGFTHIFILIQAVYPGTYAAAVNAADPRTWTELNYLSFALLSSTGIGDVIPLTPLARAVASVEMLCGLIYLAGVVARLIGLTMQQDSPK